MLKFNLAHLHHALSNYRKKMPISKILLIASLQFAYTSLFGFFATFIFLKTGNIAGSIASHSFCNAMGLPDFDVVRSSKWKTFLNSTLYFAGMLSFGYLITKI